MKRILGISLLSLSLVSGALLGASAFAKSDPLSHEQRNKATFGKILASAINAHNLAALDEFVAPSMVDHDLPPGTPPGPGGTRAKLGAFVAAFPDIHFTFESEVYQGDKLAGRGYFVGTQTGPFNGIPATGKKVKVSFMDQWRFEDGKVVEYWGQADRLGLMQQLGVIPAPSN